MIQVANFFVGNKIITSIILLSLCFFFFGFGFEKKEPEFKNVKEVRIPKIDEFSKIYSFTNGKKDQFVVYTIYGDKIIYSFVNEGVDTITQIKSFEKTKGFRFIGFAGENLILSKKNALQIYNLLRHVTFNFDANLPYGDFSKARAQQANSMDANFYSNYRVRFNRKRKADCTNSEYAEFLTSSLKNNFISEISIKNEKVSIDTMLTGVLSPEIFKGNSFGNSSLGCTDFGDSVCFYSYYEDKLFFYNKSTKEINPFQLESKLNRIKLEAVSFELMASDYNEFSNKVTKDALYYALIERVLFDKTRNLMYVAILHDEDVPGERIFSWLIYKDGKKIFEKDFDSSFNSFDSFIHNGQLYINKKTEDETYSYYSVFDVVF